MIPIVKRQSGMLPSKYVTIIFFLKPTTLTINNLDELQVFQRIFVVFARPVVLCGNVVGE